jgi:UDP-2,3-diacylglucosamine hydrolase
MYLNIDESAIFIADSHYNLNKDKLKEILFNIKLKKIDTKQLFLMGDIFDFLSDDISYFQKQNKNIIDLINDLSSQIEVIYLEGNHDFNLNLTFPNILVISREYQPLLCKLNNQKIALAHGDIFMPKSYEFFTNFIRSQATGKILNLLDINNFIFKKLDLWLLNKNICEDMKDFNNFAQNRINLYQQKYDIDIIIEAHYHQDKRYKNYINLPSLFCNKKYFSAKEI